MPQPSQRRAQNKSPNRGVSGTSRTPANTGFGNNVFVRAGDELSKTVLRDVLFLLKPLEVLRFPCAKAD